MTDFSNTPIADLAAIVAHHLQEKGIDVVLVGGLAVELYSDNLYLTQDIDLVNTSNQHPRQLSAAMAELGFYKKGRVYSNDSTAIVVEFPTAPLSVGDELIRSTTVKRVGNRNVPILKVEDVIKDRLSAYLHWQDRQSLVQTVALLFKNQLQPEHFKPFFSEKPC